MYNITKLYDRDFIPKNKKFTVDKPSDIENIPLDIELLSYYRSEAINFSLPKNLRKIRLLDNYEYSLDFLKNTRVTTLSIWTNRINDLSSIPENIQTLEMMHLKQPLLNIPSTVKQIFIFFEPDADLILKSKIPHDCEIFYGEIADELLKRNYE